MCGKPFPVLGSHNNTGVEKCMARALLFVKV